MLRVLRLTLSGSPCSFSTMATMLESHARRRTASAGRDVPSSISHRPAHAVFSVSRAMPGERHLRTNPEPYAASASHGVRCSRHVDSVLRFGVRSAHDVHVYILPADLKDVRVLTGACSPTRSRRLR